MDNYAEAGKDFWPVEIAWLKTLFGEECVTHKVQELTAGYYRHTIIIEHCPLWEWDGDIEVIED